MITKRNRKRAYIGIPLVVAIWIFWLFTSRFDTAQGIVQESCTGARDWVILYPNIQNKRCIRLRDGTLVMDAFSTYDSSETIRSFYMHQTALPTMRVVQKGRHDLILQIPTPCSPGYCEITAALLQIDDPVIGLTSVNILFRSRKGSNNFQLGETDRFLYFDDAP